MGGFYFFISGQIIGEVILSKIRQLALNSTKEENLVLLLFS